MEITLSWAQAKQHGGPDVSGIDHVILLFARKQMFPKHGTISWNISSSSVEKFYSICSFCGVLRDKKIQYVKFFYSSCAILDFLSGWQIKAEMTQFSVQSVTQLISNICVLTIKIFSWVLSLLNVVAAFSLMIKSNSVWNHIRAAFFCQCTRVGLTQKYCKPVLVSSTIKNRQQTQLLRSTTVCTYLHYPNWDMCTFCTFLLPASWDTHLVSEHCTSTDGTAWRIWGSEDVYGSPISRSLFLTTSLKEK